MKMADYTLTVTIPDNKQTEFIAALRWHFGKKEDGNEYSASELRAKLKESLQNSMSDIFKRYKVYLRDQTIIDGDLGTS
jgi:hypothetical protein